MGTPRAPRRVAASLAALPVAPRRAEAGVVHVVIETSRGTRNKLAYDPRLGVLRLKKVLPAGSTFPYDFGFVPGTRAGDGDPLDALVILDERLPAATLVEARVLAVLRMRQRKGGRVVRNDRLLTVALESRDHAALRTLADLDARLLDELEAFFESYQKVLGGAAESEGYGDRAAALRVLARATRAAAKAPGGNPGSRRAGSR